MAYRERHFGTLAVVPRVFEAPSREWPEGALSGEAVAATPGRASDAQIAPKPTADETPWRSLCYVSHRHSADGNSYAKDEPIPEAEALRQGVYSPVKADEMTPRRQRMTCPRCGGTGLHSKRRMIAHAEACACPMCKPCSVCNGHRYVRKEDASDGERQAG